MKCLLHPPGPRFKWSLNCAMETSGGSPCATRGRLLSRHGGQLERLCAWVVPEASLVSEEPGLGWSVSAMRPLRLYSEKLGTSTVGFRVRLLGVYLSSRTYSVTLGKPLNLSVSWFLLEKIMTPAISDNSCCIINPFQNFIADEPLLWLGWFQPGSSGCSSAHPHTLLGWQIVRWLCFQG